jgi:GDP-L-fucose synthase
LAKTSDGRDVYSLAGKRVWVAGHGGMVGSALVRRLAGEACQVITVGHAELDLRRQAEVEAWLAEMRPEAVFLAAATVGGILANHLRPAEFLYDNIAIEANVIDAAWRVGVEKLMLLGSACIYPRDAAQPIVEDAMLTGALEPTNQWYAIAKIAGIKLCQAYRRQYGADFISAMPNNVYGTHDRFDAEMSHVIPALMLKMHGAKETGAGRIEVWGTGAPRREFVHVDDLADALVFLMRRYSGEDHINIGSGGDITIGELARIIARVVGYRGELAFDASKPDGMARKLLDGSRLREMGWRATTGLEDGLAATYAWYRSTIA